MKIAVCDDEKIIFDELNNLLNQYAVLKEIPILTTHFKSGRELLISSEKFDVIFMDYQMNDLNGMETSRIIRTKNSDVIIIFLTAFSNIVFQSFEVNTFRFLVKPIAKEKLFKTLDDYFNSIRTDNFLMVNTNDGLWKIKLSDIIYIESKEKHTIIRTSNNYLECCKYLGEIEKMLPQDQFIRTHRACIVSFLHIRNHDNKVIYFDNNEYAGISRRYLPNFKKALQKYIIRYNSKD